jgi:hypothetical protein
MIRAKAEAGFLAVRCPACGEPHEVPVNEREQTPREWFWNGSLEKPTLVPSLLVRWKGVDPPVTGKVTARVCHSHVRDGRIEYLADCTHGLKGQTVELPPW